LAIASLVFGIIGFFTGLGIVAVVLGHISLAKIKKSAGRLGGRGMAIGGLVTGYVSLFVVALALALGGLIAMMGNVSESAKHTRVTADFCSIESALRMYKLNAGTYPTTEQGLRALVERPTSEPVPRQWSQLMKSVPKDAWNHEYEYRFPGSKDVTEFEIMSRGKDGIRGTEDDMSSQEQ
jgi:general secretion pathway protein G